MNPYGMLDTGARRPITAAGRKLLRQEKSEWAELVSAVARIMKPTAEEADQ